MRYSPEKKRKVRVIIVVDEDLDGPNGGLRHLKNSEKSTLSTSLARVADELSEFFDYILTLGMRRGTFGVLLATFATLSLSLYRARETAQEVVNSLPRTKLKPRTLNSLLGDPAVLSDAFAGVDKVEEKKDSEKSDEPDISIFKDFLDSLDDT